MTLAIAVKGTEGIVLAVDSRVTLQFSTQQSGHTAVIPATYDNAIKLLKVKNKRSLELSLSVMPSLIHNSPERPAASCKNSKRAYRTRACPLPILQPS
jgi:hypothetical protein